MLTEVEASHALFSHLITNVKFLAEAFNSIIFSHIRRLCNSVAHNLVKDARHVNSLFVWIENVPPHLSFITSTNVTRFFFFFF